MHLDYTTFIKINGKDTRTFLQGQISSDINNISATQSGIGAHCTHKGKTIATFYLLERDDSIYLIVHRSLAVTLMLHLNKYAAFSNVDISVDSTISAYGVIGEQNINKLQKHFTSTPTNHFETITENNISCINMPGQAQRFLLVGDTKNLQELLTQSNIPTPTDTHTWKVQDLLVGIVTLYPATSEKFTPNMLNFDKLSGISYTKGCYIGQEIVARTHHLGKLKRHAHSLTIKPTTETKQLKPGDPLKDKDKENGIVLDSVMLDNDRQLIQAVVSDAHINS